MPKIETRSTVQKQYPDGNRTTYEPLHISEELVEEMASLLYTQELIAKRFKISRDTLLAKYGEAYQRGYLKTYGLLKSESMRAIHDMKRWREEKDFPGTAMERERSWADKDAPFDKMMRLRDRAEERFEPMMKEAVEEVTTASPVTMTKGDESV